MIVSPTKVLSVLSISVTRHGDARGFFAETYNRKVYSRAGIKAVFLQQPVTCDPSH